MNKYDRYLTVCSKLHRRYMRPDERGRHYINRSVGGVPTRYTYLEVLAAEKYLGCDPAETRLGSDFAKAPKNITIWCLPA